MSRPVIRLGLSEGTIGEAVSVNTNCFEVSSLPEQPFHHYHEFPGDNKLANSRDRCLQVIDKLQVQHPEVFTPRAPYDGKHNLFRGIPLPLPNNSSEFRVIMGSGRARPNSNQGQGGVIVRISRVATIDPMSLRKVINGQTGHNSNSLMTLTLLNVIVKMKPILSYPSNKTSFFTEQERESLGGGLQVWRGLYQSVRPSINRLVVNVDTTVAIMYQDGNLLDVVLEFMEARKNVRDLVPTALKGPQRKRLTEFLKNLMIAPTTPAPDKNPRWKKIRNVVFVGADDFRFAYDRAGGEQISITEYYRTAYNYRMQCGKIICVSVRADNSVVFPLEVLKVKPGQFYKKTLPSKMAAKALEFSSQKPETRVRSLEGSAGLLGYGDSDFLRQSGVVVRPQLLTIKSRILPAPPLKWAKSRPEEAPRGGAWNLADKMFYAPGNIQAWSVINFDTKPNIMSEGYGVVTRFLMGFLQCCSNLGMSFPRAPPPIIQGRPGSGLQGHREDMEKAASAAMQAFGDQFGPGSTPRPTFVLVILPDLAADIYTNIKNWGDCFRGCPTQCIRSSKLWKPNNSYFSNLALKLNVKIDGINSVPGTSPLKKALESIPTMIIGEGLRLIPNSFRITDRTVFLGADVSHSSGTDSRPSVAGLVASMDENFSQYGAITSVQSPLNEIIEDMDTMVESAVRNFFTFWSKRGTPVVPQRIIFYRLVSPLVVPYYNLTSLHRDGVSEGQFEQVKTEEVQKIKAALSNIWKSQKFQGNPPALTFIVVGKKHHVRFFPKDNRARDRSGNCPAGTVIDKDIVSPTDYDFYLQSHSGLLGTSRPAHYSVILDENRLGADQLQALSYMLCHVYGRATRSVSIPAPVYYADIVCARGRIHSALIHDGSDSASMASGLKEYTLDDHKKAFQPVADFMRRKMYFM